MKTIYFLILLCSAQLAVGQNWFGAMLTAQHPVATGDFSPSNLSGLKIWLKPESLTGNNGDLITQWADSSGNNYRATNATVATRPYFTNAILNGFSGVAFTGVVTRLYFGVNGAASILSGAQSASAFFVLRDTSTAAAQWMNFSRNGSPTQTRMGFGKFNATTFDVSGRRLDTDSLFRSDAATMPEGFILVALNANWEASSALAWTNGVLAINDDTWGTDGAVDATDSDVLSLGSANAGSIFAGWMCEVLLYVPALSDSDRQKVEAYTRSKYALW